MTGEYLLTGGDSLIAEYFPQPNSLYVVLLDKTTEEESMKWWAKERAIHDKIKLENQAKSFDL